MLIKSILKEIKIKNSDTDSYAQLIFDIDLNFKKNYKIDLNELYEMKHKELRMELKKR